MAPRRNPMATTFRKRKACITRKIRELCILCDVKACAVIVGPDGDVSTWPENQVKVKSVIDLYRNFIRNTKKKGKLLEKELEKQQQQRVKKKVSMSDWDESWLNGFTTRESLLSFLEAVRVKSQDFKQRSEVLVAKNRQQIHEETMQLQPTHTVPDFGGFNYNAGFDSSYEALLNGNGSGNYSVPLNYYQGAMNFSHGSLYELNASDLNNNETWDEINFDYLGDNFTDGLGFDYTPYSLQPQATIEDFLQQFGHGGSMDAGSSRGN